MSRGPSTPAGDDWVRAARGAALFVVLVVAAAACGQARSPARLRDAHVAALKADDPAAAYALLAPEVRAAVPYAEFEARWKEENSRRWKNRRHRERESQQTAPGVSETTMPRACFLGMV